VIYSSQVNKVKARFNNLEGLYDYQHSQQVYGKAEFGLVPALTLRQSIANHRLRAGPSQ
jgi:hypothetical protein